MDRRRIQEENKQHWQCIRSLYYAEQFRGTSALSSSFQGGTSGCRTLGYRIDREGHGVCPPDRRNGPLTPTRPPVSKALMESYLPIRAHFPDQVRIAHSKLLAWQVSNSRSIFGRAI